MDFARRAQSQYQSTSRAVVVLWNMHYLQAGQVMRGFQQFFVNLMTDRDLAHAILSKLHRVYLRRVEDFCRAWAIRSTWPCSATTWALSNRD